MFVVVDSPLLHLHVRAEYEDEYEYEDDDEDIDSIIDFDESDDDNDSNEFNYNDSDDDNSDSNCWTQHIISEMNNENSDNEDFDYENVYPLAPKVNEKKSFFLSILRFTFLDPGCIFRVAHILK